MVAISIQGFGGIAPATPPRYLEDQQAQNALNVVPWYGSASSLVEPSDSVYSTSYGATVQSIYKWGNDFPQDDLYWFEFDGDTDVVQGFIAGDTTERTFLTSDSTKFPKPAATNATLARASAPLPSAWRMLGVPIAPDIDSLAVTDIPETEVSENDPETRVYVITRVNNWGEEGPPSSPATTEVRVGQQVTIDLPSVGDTSNFEQDFWRIYRTATGSTSTEYLFVAEVPVGTAQYIDQKDGDQLGEPCPSIDWFPPPEDLKGLKGLPNGVLVGFTGNEIWFSEPYRPFAWPTAYQQAVDAKIIGLGTIDTTVVVLTDGKPWFIQGSDPSSMIMVEGDIKQSCVSKRSIVSMGGAVVYASPDGLIAAAPNGSRNLTQNIFTKVQWQALVNPSSLQGYMYEERYHGFYDTGAVQAGFITDMGATAFVYHDEWVQAGYSDLESDTLFVCQNGLIKKWEQGTVLKRYTWRSKLFTLPSYVPMSCFRVLAEDYTKTGDSRIRFTVWKDKDYTAPFHQAWVESDKIHRLPSGLGKAWEFQIESEVEIYFVGMGQSPSEISDGD